MSARSQVAGFAGFAAIAGAAVLLAGSPARGGSQLWAHLGSSGFVSAMAVSPDSHAVYVTGTTGSQASGNDYLTVAYNASTGAELWSASYNGPANGNDGALALTVSPDGRTVFVTGGSAGVDTGTDYATVAYNASTGVQLWASLYNGIDDGGGSPTAIAVDPGGQLVFVTGASQGVATFGKDCATVAYDAATGTQVWARRFSASASYFANCQTGQTLAVSPDGHTVFVSAGASPQRYTTIAYTASAGVIRWISQYKGPTPASQKGPGHGNDGPTALTVSPDGKLVFVTGFSQGAKSNLDYGTVAYATATGRTVWTARYNSPANRADTPTSMTTALGGRLVIVTGTSRGLRTGDDYATVAYAAATGRRVWVERYNDAANLADLATSIAAGPGGRSVYVTGTSFAAHLRPNFATVSYDAATGAKRWVSVYRGPGGHALAGPVAVSPDGGGVFVAGKSNIDPRQFTTYYFATVGYQS